MYVAQIEGSHRARAKRSARPGFWPVGSGGSLGQATARDREGPSRFTMIVKAGLLSWQPAQQPDLVRIVAAEPEVPPVTASNLTRSLQSSGRLAICRTVQASPAGLIRAAATDFMITIFSYLFNRNI